MSARITLPVRTVMRMLPAMAALAFGLAAPPASAADAARSADAAMGLRYCELAQQVVRVASPTDADWRQCAALLGAARIADPTEARYPRLLAHAMRKLGNADGAIEALTAFRKLRPGDQAAQVELIGLYLARMQSADQKVDYLKDVLARDSIPAEVRSELAAQCAAVLLESGKDDLARQMTERALSLNGLNLRAMAMKSRWLNDGPAERASLLLGMLRSNPLQGDVVLSIARLAGRSGLVKEAADWYALCVYMSPPADVRLEFACALFLNEETVKTASILDGLIAADPRDYESLVLRILIEKRSEKRDAVLLGKLRALARNTLLNRLAVARRAIGVIAATTRPVSDEPVALPDLSGDVALASKAPKAEARDAYVLALGELAWFEVYYNDQADEAEGLLKILNPVARDTDPLAARLAGWIYLARDRKEEAKVKLSAAAGANDRRAALGLIRTFSSSPEDQIKAKSEAQRLLGSEPAGPLAALLFDAVRDLGAKVVPNADGPALRAVLSAFPGEFMNIIVRPQGFYSLRCEPLKISHAPCEPLLARVTLQNNSEFDLTIGDDGIIKPAVCIDAQIQGSGRQVFSGVCVEHLSDLLVLKSRQNISRVVRVDQNRLAEFLQMNPAAVTLGLAVRTNALSPVGSGPCGYAALSTGLMERAAMAVTDQGLAKLMAVAATAGGEEKIRALELTGLLSHASQSVDEGPLKSQARALRDALRKAQNDPQPSVRAFAAYLYVLSSTPQDQTEPLEQMLTDASWQTRLLGLMALSYLTPDHPLSIERRKALVAQVAQEGKEPLVREFAAASAVILAQLPATQPATRPSTLPGPVLP